MGCIAVVSAWLDKELSFHRQLSDVYGIRLSEKPEYMRNLSYWPDSLSELFERYEMELVDSTETERLKSYTKLDDEELRVAVRVYAAFRENEFSGQSLAFQLLTQAGLNEQLVSLLCNSLRPDEPVNFPVLVSIISTFCRGSVEEQLAYIFALFDYDGSGTLSFEEVTGVVWLATKYHYSEMEFDRLIEELFHILDVDKDGAVHFEEFIDAFPAACELLNNNEHLDLGVRRSIVESSCDSMNKSFSQSTFASSMVSRRIFPEKVVPKGATRDGKQTNEKFDEKSDSTIDTDIVSNDESTTNVRPSQLFSPKKSLSFKGGRISRRERVLINKAAHQARLEHRRGRAREQASGGAAVVLANVFRSVANRPRKVTPCETGIGSAVEVSPHRKPDNSETAMPGSPSMLVGSFSSHHPYSHQSPRFVNPVPGDHVLGMQQHHAHSNPNSELDGTGSSARYFESRLEAAKSAWLTCNHYDDHFDESMTL